ncbi:hypothetical protein D3C87_1501390 [compost metagenome]
MRIAYVANLDEQIPPKKTAKEERLERCMLMIKNERIKDRKRAEKLFEKRLAIIEIKIKQLGL